MTKVRRALSNSNNHEIADNIIAMLKKTKNNNEFVDAINSMNL